MQQRSQWDAIPEKVSHVDVLKNHGLNCERVDDGYWFVQILLPHDDPFRSGIKNDGTKACMRELWKNINVHGQMSKGWGGGYEHVFRNVKEDELVRWCGFVIEDNVRDGTSNGIHCR